MTGHDFSRGVRGLPHGILLGGIDEAGRGPVLGPMVLALVVMDRQGLQELKALGVKDSKLLSPAKRAELYQVIVKTAKHWATEWVWPVQIDAALRDPQMNLNHLEAQRMAMLIRTAPEKSMFMVDCPSTNTSAFEDKVKEFLGGEGASITAMHHADTKHTIVGAASILAKHSRDAEIESLRAKMGEDFGSGYPSDPKTVAFLKAHLGDPKLDGVVRKTWATYTRLAAGQ